MYISSLKEKKDTLLMGLETTKHKNESVNIRYWQSKPTGSFILLLCSNIVFTNLNMMKIWSEVALSEEKFQINQFYTKPKIVISGFSNQSVMS